MGVDIRELWCLAEVLGATHGKSVLRRPNLFDRLLALSGLYSAGYGFGSYTDEVVHRNSLRWIFLW